MISDALCASLIVLLMIELYNLRADYFQKAVDVCGPPLQPPCHLTPPLPYIACLSVYIH